jgi:hypothetical protein
MGAWFITFWHILLLCEVKAKYCALKLFLKLSAIHFGHLGSRALGQQGSWALWLLDHCALGILCSTPGL